MEQSEIMRRVVGILTEAIEMRRQVRWVVHGPGNPVHGMALELNRHGNA
ncbi:hypothetical protein ACFY4I_02130 [Streptomyces scabiei]